jgi:hypothetical protein
MTLENSSAMELQDPVVPQNPIQVLAREGHSRLASILRELVANLPQEFPTSTPGSRSPEDGAVVFTPFRPPPLDQGTWMDRARQVAVAAAVLRREAPNAARDWLDERCGLRFDESQVERAALTLDSQIRGWRRRRLPRHFWLFVLTWRERISQNSGSECLPATCLVAVDQHGYRMVADFALGTTSNPQWSEIFRALEQRGMGEICGLTARMTPGLFEAAANQWPQARLQVCQKQFLSRVRGATASVKGRRSDPGFRGDPMALAEGWAKHLSEGHPISAWVKAPGPGQASALSVVDLPRELQTPLASVSWLEREMRSVRNHASQDEVPTHPAMKARLLSSAMIEWEGVLDARKPFLSDDAILEVLQSHPKVREPRSV